MKGTHANNKRHRAEPPSVSPVNHRVDEFFTFVRAVVSERDSALSDVVELTSKMEYMASDVDRTAALEKDVEYWRNDREVQKTARDNYEMELRRANAEINELKSACVKVGKEAENLKKIARSKDGHAERVAQENAQLRQDAGSLAAELSRKEGATSALHQELQTARSEIERLAAALLARESECGALREESGIHEGNIETLRQDLVDSERELASLKLESGGEKARLAQRVQVLEKLIDDAAYLFYDAIHTAPNGSGYLLGSGKMLSMDSIARLWIRDGKFNGEPTYHIKCVQTDTVTTVVHSPAVCRFVQSVAASVASLNTTPEFYFRYSERPADQQPAGTPWRAYSPYDQLTLVAKLIYMFNADQASCSFQAMVMDNHVVTATCTKDLAARTARVSLSLNVTTKQGVAHRHCIEFVGGSFFPDSFVIANE